MASTSKLSAEFNDFLFATVCDEGGERRLSVISALARLDLDPWAEAAELARMPEASAASRLRSLLAGLVEEPPAQPDRATIAARLVALLPTSPATAFAPRAPVASTTLQSRLIHLMFLLFLASMAASVLTANLAPRAGASAPPPGPTHAAAAHS